MTSRRTLIPSILLLASALLLGSPGAVFAQGKAKLAKEAAEYVMKKFGKEAAEEGVETLAKKVEALAVRHGDEVFDAVRKVGPRALRLADEAGEHGLSAIRLMAKYGDKATWIVAQPKRLSLVARFGDDAAEALLKHREVAEPLIEAMAKPAAGALSSISGQNGRRLAMMFEDGALPQIGRTEELLAVVRKYGDKAMDFIWKNKGALAVGAALTAFLANPEPFFDGAADITKVVAENVAPPLGRIAGDVASEAASKTNWTLVTVASLAALGAVVSFKSWLRHRQQRSLLR
jgi:hypothetical protein